MKQKRAWRWTSVLSIALIALLSGIGLAKFINIGADILWASVVLLLVGVVTHHRDKRLFYAAFIVFCLIFGLWRGSVYAQKVKVYDAILYKNATIEAVAQEDGVYDNNGQLTFTVNNIVVTEPVHKEVVGQMEISGFGETAVYRDDRLKISGLVFPKKGANQAGIRYADLAVLRRGESPINSLRREFAASLQNVLPEPQASFALGLLIGQRSTLSKTLSDELIAVGLIHIVAVSGYNLTVIINACKKLFIRRSRYQTLIFSLTLIGLFLLLTGNSPSIVRAALVSGLGLIAWYFGRTIKPLLLLLLAAVITAIVNPLYVWTSIGWYLSFTAFFGVLILAPLLQKRFLSRTFRDKLLPTMLIETTAAQLCTLPIVLLVFGRLSTIGIIANLLVVPIVPFAMLFSLFAGLTSLANTALSGIIALPARLVLDYILSLSGLLSKVPYANVPFSVSATQMVFLYTILLLVVVFLYHQTSRLHGTIPQENKE